MRPCVYVTWQQASRDWVSQPRFLTDGQGLEGGGHDHDHGQEPQPRIFIRKKIWNSVHTRTASADMTATFHLLQLFLTSFRSIGLLLMLWPASNSKPAETNPHRRNVSKSETSRKKRERERERERARWGTRIKTRLCVWHACSTNFFLSFGTYPWANDVATVGTEGCRRRFRCLPSASARNSLTNSSTRQGNAVFMALNRAQCVHHFPRPAIP